MRRLAPLLFLLGLAACHSRGQLVLGLATDLSARGDLDEVTLKVVRRGDASPTVEHQWSLSGVPAQDFRLPGSFNLYANDGQEPAFDVYVDGLLNGVVKVERHAVLGIVKGSDRFVRLSLAASCQTLGCPASLTCVEGTCVPLGLDAHRLPVYHASMVSTVQCSSGTTFIDTSTHEPMPSDGAGCAADETCSEGTCVRTTAPGADTTPFTGGPASVFGFDGAGSGAFATVGAIDTARYFATATQLGDGRVLVVGGLSSFAADGSGTPVSGAVIYDGTFAAFRRIADPPSAIAGHTATLLADGTVLFVGASDGAAVAFTFDPATETFTTAGAPAVARQFHTASLLWSGQVLIVGGLSGTSIAATAEKYDPTTRAFTTMNSAPLAARYFHAATVLSSNDVLFSGGVVGGTTAAQPTASVERYDAATDSFVAAPSMSVPRAMHTATRLSDDSVLAVGGFATLPGTAVRPVEMLGHAPQILDAVPPFAAGLQQAVALGNDRILFVGGSFDVDPDPSATPTAGAYLYDGGTFTMLPPPGYARVAAFAAPVPTSTGAIDVLVGGGVEMGAAPIDGGVDAASPDFSTVDLSMPDLATVCDPVTSAGCSGKCTVSGASMFMPGVDSFGPRCVAAPVGGLHDLQPCTPPTDAGSDDGCAPGFVCMNDPTTNTPTCQVLCHSDADCANDGSRNTCALVVQGPNTSGIGVCQIGCNYPDNTETCYTAGANLTTAYLSCHFAPHVAVAGGAPQITGVCQLDGTQYLSCTGDMAPPTCDEKTQATSCGSDLFCTQGLCQGMCSMQAGFCANACMPFDASDPQGYGMCAPVAAC